MDDAKPIVKKLGAILKKFSKYEIKIEGHTDNVPISRSNRYGSNMALSAARAGSVYDYLVNTVGISSDNLSTAGYGENKPIASNNTASGRAKNRRVVVKIMTAEN
jgi:chemotaxis protein MotB